MGNVCACLRRIEQIEKGLPNRKQKLFGKEQAIKAILACNTIVKRNGIYA
jgi:hypothetical protein